MGGLFFYPYFCSVKADDYLEVNRKNWDSKVEAHVQSEFYNLKGFKDGENALNDIELELLGNVQGKSILHLQCHFGMDTLSLARMGAEVTGIDFSPIAISKAKELSKELEIFGEFVCADVYSTPEIIAKQFDIVFTSKGSDVADHDMGRSTTYLTK